MQQCVVRYFQLMVVYPDSAFGGSHSAAQNTKTGVGISPRCEVGDVLAIEREEELPFRYACFILTFNKELVEVCWIIPFACNGDFAENISISESDIDNKCVKLREVK